MDGGIAAIGGEKIPLYLNLAERKEIRCQKWPPANLSSVNVPAHSCKSRVGHLTTLDKNKGISR